MEAETNPRPAAAPRRADARRNEARVLDAAREAFAAGGLDASYHDIARRAGVGVGTVYRRFPDRDALLEAVLVDILDSLSAEAEAASADPDGWQAFAAFFTGLSMAVRRHAGLSGRLDGRGGARVATARDRLLRAIRRLHGHARADGLRPDVGWQDVLFLAQAAAAEGCGFDLDVGEGHRRRALAVILDGLRARP